MASWRPWGDQVPSQRERALWAGAAAALAVQVVHLTEHLIQLGFWFRYPNRAPWMSEWAMGAARWLGRVRLDRNAMSSPELARGMEFLHLGGNLVFLLGTFLVWCGARPQPEARKWARAALVVQALHVVEHLVLTATVVVTGRAVGLSTALGALDGTRLTTYRVWWHVSINFVASGLCLMALAHLNSWVATGEARFRVRATRALPSLLAVLILLPFTVALVGGTSQAGTGTHHSDHHTHMESETQSVGTGDAALADVAAQRGLSVTHSAFRWDASMDPVAMMGGGLCWIDVDGDGWLDLFITDTWSDGEWGLWNSDGGIPTMRVFANLAGRFEERTQEWGLGYEARANGCVAADLDGDGWTDLYVTTARENLLFWNQAGTGFVEGGADAGADTYGWHTGVAAGDIDGDGLVDLVVAGYADLNRSRPEASTGFPNTFEPIADVVLVNRGPSGSGRVQFEAVDAGLEDSGFEYGLGVSLADVDGDADLDLLVANDTQPNRLYLNHSNVNDPSPWFEDASAASGADDSGSGMGIALGDLNADHRPDLVITNLAGQGHVAVESVVGAQVRFQPGSLDAIEDLGRRSTGWGASFGDLDLDGDLDLIVASGAIPIEDLSADGEPLTYLENQGTAQVANFVDASAQVGLDQVAPMNGRSIALADYDNDGDLDAAISAIGQALVLLNNDLGPGNWLLVDAGTPAPGMRVWAELADGVILERTATSGSSWLSSEDPRVHLGLGHFDAVARLTVDIPGCDQQAFENLAARQILTIEPCR